MASYCGTTGLHAFGGQPNEVNDHYFEAGEFSSLDIIAGADGGGYNPLPRP